MTEQQWMLTLMTYMIKRLGGSIEIDPQDVFDMPSMILYRTELADGRFRIDVRSNEVLQYEPQDGSTESVLEDTLQSDTN